MANRLEDADGPDAHDVARVFRDVERHAHVRLRTEIVDFVGLEVIEELHHLHGVGEVAIVEVELYTVHMRIAVEMVDTARVKGRGAADNAVNLVAFAEQKLGEIGAVLTRDTGNERFFHAAKS